MTTTHAVTSLEYSVLVVLASGIGITDARAQAPAPVPLGITADTNVIVSVNDPANHVWIVQHSSDMQEWSEVGAWKVYNGTFHRSFSTEPPVGFFRAWYDPERDDAAATLDTALGLPTSSFNHAAPALTPILFQPPIVNQDNMPGTNVTTDAGATLGRVLFYDQRLSTN